MGNEQSSTRDRGESDEAINRRAIKTMDKAIRKKVRRGVTYNMKLLIRGERGVGKTALMCRLQGKPIPETYIRSPGIQTAKINWTLKDLEDNIQIEMWDVVDNGFVPEDQVVNDEGPLVGDERKIQQHIVDATTVDVYNGAHGVVFLLDITKVSSYEYVKAQLELVPAQLPTLVLGTFRDLGNNRKVFKEDIHELLHGSDRTKRTRRPHEIQYFECSLLNCYGLHVLHRYLNIPFLNLKLSTLRQQMRLIETELATTKHDMQVMISEQRYLDYVEYVKAEDLDIKTGRAKSFSAASDTNPLPDEPQLIRRQSTLETVASPSLDVEDLPERRSSVAMGGLKYGYVNEEKQPEPSSREENRPDPQEEEEKATPPMPISNVKSIPTNIEDFKVANTLDSFYSSDEDSDQDDDVMMQMGVSHVHRKAGFVYSDSEEDENDSNSIVEKETDDIVSGIETTFESHIEVVPSALDQTSTESYNTTSDLGTEENVSVVDPVKTEKNVELTLDQDHIDEAEENESVSTVIESAPVVVQPDLKEDTTGNCITTLSTDESEENLPASVEAVEQDEEITENCITTLSTDESEENVPASVEAVEQDEEITENCVTTLSTDESEENVPASVEQDEEITENCITNPSIDESVENIPASVEAVEQDKETTENCLTNPSTDESEENVPASVEAVEQDEEITDKCSMTLSTDESEENDVIESHEVSDSTESEENVPISVEVVEQDEEITDNCITTPNTDESEENGMTPIEVVKQDETIPIERSSEKIPSSPKLEIDSENLADNDQFIPPTSSKDLNDFFQDSDDEGSAEEATYSSPPAALASNLKKKSSSVLSSDVLAAIETAKAHAMEMTVELNPEPKVDSKRKTRRKKKKSKN